ncbi:MAG: TonB-dependent receptor, partial [Sphingomonadaceae bacterium]|nr:TonB-dependent receptor [Sphingomonadaceae bacterium]
SLRVSDNIEGYILGEYSNSEVDPRLAPSAIRQRQPYGAPPSAASNNPGIVLPVYVCSAGVNCTTAADRRLNPNNPFAAAYANDPTNGAARIYYLFGDITAGSNRNNEVIRGAAGLNGSFGDGFNWRVEGVLARDNIRIDAFGIPNIAGLRQVVNTGTYNFVDPTQNSAAVRNIVAPVITAVGNTTLGSIDGSISKALFQLPGGALQVLIGGQYRRETQNYPGLNPNLLNYANTAAAFGKRSVEAGYFEINAPVLNNLEINGSGRYDNYSEGFSHFSPKIGAKFTPVRQFAIRGTYSEGFRAPTFAESNPRSSYPGFVTYQPPANFVAAHGGSGNPYSQSYSIGGGFSGNPNLRPEKSTSFTAGAIFQPVRWFSFTVDYYNVKKTDVIVAGPNAGQARANYYAGLPLPAGYTIGALDAVDPLFPNAQPRVLVINGPYVNAGYFKTSGLDFAATVSAPITNDIKFTSRLDLSTILKFDVDFGDGVVRKYAGTIGPYELSSGAGTPKWRGNWQNTIEYGPFSLTATTYYVSPIKQVGADDLSPVNGQIDYSCAGSASAFYPYPDAASTQKYCTIRRFTYSDLNLTIKGTDKFSFYMIVNNFTNERAPLAVSSYSGTNYLPTWHYAGVIGRVFRAGANFKF